MKKKIHLIVLNMTFLFLFPLCVFADSIPPDLNESQFVVEKIAYPEKSMVLISGSPSTSEIQTKVQPSYLAFTGVKSLVKQERSQNIDAERNHSEGYLAANPGLPAKEGKEKEEKKTKYAKYFIVGFISLSITFLVVYLKARSIPKD